MNVSEYTTLTYIYRDDNYTVNPNRGKEYSDNGLYFSALDESLRDRNGFGPSPVSYRMLIDSHFKEPGLLMRNPQNKGDNEQWDNYLGVTLGCLLTNNTKTLKTILKYAVTHGFVMNNDDKLEFRDWLGRYPHLWMVMTAATFPRTKWLWFIPLVAIGLTFNPTETDQSGNLLQYVYQSCIRKIYNTDFFFNKWYKKVLVKVPDGMKEVMRQYFGLSHPFTIVVYENNKY